MEPSHAARILENAKKKIAYYEKEREAYRHEMLAYKSKLQKQAVDAHAITERLSQSMSENKVYVENLKKMKE